MNSIFAYAIQKYHANKNMADLVDYVQENVRRIFRFVLEYIQVKF